MNLEEYKNKMTLFYSKRTGEIQTFCTGVQDMSLFGDNKEDYEMIWDFVVIDYNDAIFNNYSLFKVDTSTQKIMLKENVFNLNL